MRTPLIAKKLNKVLILNDGDMKEQKYIQNKI